MKRLIIILILLLIPFTSEGATRTWVDGEGITSTEDASNFTVDCEDATTTNKGVASFDDTYFGVSSGAVTIDDIYLKDGESDTMSGTLTADGFITTGTATADVVDTQYLEYGSSEVVTVRDSLTVKGTATADVVDTQFIDYSDGGAVTIRDQLTVGGYTLPTNDGTSTQVLTTDGSGTLSWNNQTGTGGASTALDNLASVAISESLISDTDNTDDLGSSSKGWKDLYLDGTATADVVDTNYINYSTGGSVIIQDSIEVAGTATSDVVDTQYINYSSGGNVEVQDKLTAKGYDVGTTVITVTDFTDEGIQAAIDALPTEGGTVQLLPGSYECDEQINLPSRNALNITIAGSGKETILNHSATDSTDCIKLTGPGSSYASRAYGLTLRDFKIVGNASSGDGISLINTHYGTVKNIWIDNSGAYGINVSQTGTTTYENVVVEYCTSGGFNLGTIHQNRVVNCEASENDGAGITIGISYESVVIGCAFEYNSPNMLIQNSTASVAPGVIVGNQMTSTDSSDGVRIVNATHWGIRNNLIGNNNGDGLQSTNGHRLSISGNVMHGNTQYPMKLVTSSGNQIVDNYMTENLYGDTIYQDSECYNNRIYNSELGTDNDDIISFGTPSIIENCDDAWVAKTDVTSTANTAAATKMEGSGSSKNVIDGAFGSGLIATEDFDAINLSGDTKVGFWIYPTETVAANVLELVLDDSAACASPLETLSIPALTTDRWEYVQLDFATPANLTAVISVGLNADSDPGALTVYIDDITTEYPKVWYDVSESELRATADIVANNFITTGTATADVVDTHYIEYGSGETVILRDVLQLQTLEAVPSSPTNGMIWMESDGLHIYYNGAEKKVTDGSP